MRDWKKEMMYGCQMGRQREHAEGGREAVA